MRAWRYVHNHHATAGMGRCVHTILLLTGRRTGVASQGFCWLEFGPAFPTAAFPGETPGGILSAAAQALALVFALPVGALRAYRLRRRRAGQKVQVR